MSPWNILIGNTRTSQPRPEATAEQLYDCASLLALNIVHHRRKGGEAPIEYTVSKLGGTSQDQVTAGELYQANQILEEALALIKASSDHPTESKAPKLQLRDKRQQIRIKVSAPVYVMPDEAIAPIKAKLDNISWGGASLHIDKPIGEVGDLVHVELPSFRGHNINVRAEILRITDVGDETAYSIRFTKLKTGDEELFQQLLECLASSGDSSGQRKSARLTQRIDIQYDNTSELHATMEDISTGGMCITVPEPIELNQSLLLVISTTDQRYQLLLRARVIWQERVDSASIEVFRVGLEFEHSTDDLKERMNRLVGEMTPDSPSENFQF